MRRLLNYMIIFNLFLILIIKSVSGVSISKQISNSLDDAYQNNVYSQYNNYQYARWGGSNPYHTGLRFQSVNIPQGATITSAKISVYYQANSGIPVRADVYGEYTNNCVNFGDTNPKIHQRIKTLASVPWDITSHPGYSWFDSPDISNVIQEIVNRGGWSSGNSLCLIIWGDSSSSGYQSVRTYDYSSSLAAELTINYAIPTTTTSTTTTTTSTTTTSTTTTTISCSYNCWATCSDDTTGPDCFDRISHGTTGCTGGNICCESKRACCGSSTCCGSTYDILCGGGVGQCDDCTTKPTACDYGTCTSTQKPSWSCTGTFPLTSCTYVCSYDASCVSTTTSTSTTTTSTTTTTTTIPSTTTTSTTTTTLTTITSTSITSTSITSTTSTSTSSTTSTTTTASTTTTLPFLTWSVRKGVFTIGKPSLFIIYVQNLDTGTDNYTITPDVDYVYQGDDLSHLINIHLASDKIENLEPDKVRETQGGITLLAQVFYPPGATITFTVDSENNGAQETSIEISGGSSGGMPLALPEFTLLGFMQLLLLIGLVVFYSSHVR